MKFYDIAYHPRSKVVRTRGEFGDTYSDVICRLVDSPSFVDREVFEFVSKECKHKIHEECYETWSGLGFKVICSCICHIKKREASEELGISSRSIASNRLWQSAPSIMEIVIEV
jgi:hypothetical protein